MDIIDAWLFLGLIGWATLAYYELSNIGYEDLYQNRVKDITYSSIMRGLMFAILLGPLCFLYGFYKDRKNGK